MPNSKDVNAPWRMGGITVPAVEDYLYSLLPARDEVLTGIEAEAAKRDIPIVGPAVGRILYQLALMIGARRVFERGMCSGTLPHRTRTETLNRRRYLGWAVPGTDGCPGG